MEACEAEVEVEACEAEVEVEACRRRWGRRGGEAERRRRARRTCVRVLPRGYPSGEVPTGLGGRRSASLRRALNSVTRDT